MEGGRQIPRCKGTKGNRLCTLPAADGHGECLVQHLCFGGVHLRVFDARPLVGVLPHAQIGRGPPVWSGGLEPRDCEPHHPFGSSAAGVGIYAGVHMELHERGEHGLHVGLGHEHLHARRGVLVSLVPDTYPAYFVKFHPEIHVSPLANRIRLATPRFRARKLQPLMTLAGWSLHTLEK